MTLFGNVETRLAFSVFENKGVFALLLGSGLSRSAEIPTGWEITTDLVRRVATAEKVEAKGDWAQWYRDEHGKDPDYSELLGALASTPAERRSILHGYIEPDDEDREEGRKVPTLGHGAIAQLVRDGFIRVIVTTNFDRLMENALREVGVEPTIVSSVDALKGAEPLAHTSCYILKLHGDYKDARILNTEEELNGYPEEYNVLLDRIFDEYGLIVCGWSGEWDHALRAAILRAPNRRFPMFWASRGELKGRGKDLCDQRRGMRSRSRIPISFPTWSSKSAYLPDSQRQNPAEIDLLISRAKRYLVKPENRIQFADLLSEEVARINKRLLEADMSSGTQLTGEELVRRVNAYNGAGEGFIKLCGLIGRWGETSHLDLIGGTIRSLWISLRPAESGFTTTQSIRGYVPVMACHAAMLAMINVKRWIALRDLLKVETKNANHNADTRILRDLTGRWEGNQPEIWKMFPGQDRKHTPFSDIMFDYFEREGGSFLGVTSDYKQDFLLMEALAALISIEDHPAADLKAHLEDGGTGQQCVRMPVFGRMGWDRWGTKRLMDSFASPRLPLTSWSRPVLVEVVGNPSRSTSSICAETLQFTGRRLFPQELLNSYPFPDELSPIYCQILLYSDPRGWSQWLTAFRRLRLRPPRAPATPRIRLRAIRIPPCTAPCGPCGPCGRRGRRRAGGNRPKLTFIGWKVLASAPPVIWPAKRRRGSAWRRICPSSRRGELRKVLRWMPPRRAKAAFSRPGMVRSTSACAPDFILVWKPTMLKSVPSALSRRSWITA